MSLRRNVAAAAVVCALGAVSMVAGGLEPGSMRTTLPLPPKTPAVPQMEPSSGLGMTA